MIARLPLALAGTAMTAWLAACAHVTPAAETPPALDGTAWVLSSLEGAAPLAGSTITMLFEGGRASGTDGCNRYALPYATQGETVRFETGGPSTLMACAPDVMQQARSFLASLGGATRYRIDATGLQLLDADGAVRAGFVAQSQAIAGTSWRVTAYNNGRQAVASVRPGSALDLAFGTDGQASGSAGCNRYVAPYQASGTALSFGPAAATRRMCAEADLMEQEQQFLQALATVATARREGDRLELRTADGALAVSLLQDADR